MGIPPARPGDLNGGAHLARRAAGRTANKDHRKEKGSHMRSPNLYVRSLLALLATSSVACAPRVAPRNALPSEAIASRDPVTLEQRAALAAMPRLNLSPLVFGASVDYIVHGSTPAAPGNLLCATSTTAATWQTPASCGLADLSSTQTVSGAKTFSGGVKVTSASMTGTTVTSIGRTSISDTSPGPLAQGACATATATLNGVADNAECLIGPPNTGSTTHVWTCSKSAANTVTFRDCNLGASSAATAGTYYCLCFNH